MSESNIYVIGHFADPQRQSDMIARLAWYFTPYLDQIARIEVCMSPSEIAAIRLPELLDPAIETLLPALCARLVSVDEDRLRQRLRSVNNQSHLCLLADDGLIEDWAFEIGRFRTYGRFFRIDPNKVRMEGSFHLLAGVAAFVDVAEETQRQRSAFDRMQAEIGQYNKAYVFGTGPSLSGFIEANDLSDGLCIAANSMVKNNDLLDRMSPRIIVAADPIFHAGCSRYAAAFRASLISALDRTGAWFVCPLRDLNIYRTYLPSRHLNRIVGIGFDPAAAPTADIGRNFVLKPYPNVLTLFLLPLAATFATRIHVAGCDGRRIGDDQGFWSHDAKAQFVEEMDNIKKTHPGFFVIDYNDYYFEHSRDLEVVLQTLETAGREVVSETPSYIPALNVREAAGTRRNDIRSFAPRTLAILDPDAQGNWGHYLSYDRRLGQSTREAGLRFALMGRADLPEEINAPEVDHVVRVFSIHSWVVGNRGTKVQVADRSRLAAELDRGLSELEGCEPEGDIALFMYCGSLEIVELLEHVLVSHDRVKAAVTLFYSYNFDISDPAYAVRWTPLLRRVMGRPRQVRLFHATPQIAATFESEIGLRLPVLPHPSTTFDDHAAEQLVRKPGRALTPGRKPRILFPGGSRPEKGYLLAVEACETLARTGGYDLVLRSRLDPQTAPALRRAVARLGTAEVTLEDADLDADAFVDWLGGADVMVIPYLPEAFLNRTSGMLVDAMLLGIPVVVIEGTWLADEVNAKGSGVVVPPTCEGILNGIEAVLAGHKDYVKATRNGARDYLSIGNWAHLTEQIIALLSQESSVTASTHAGFFLCAGTDDVVPVRLVAARRMLRAGSRDAEALVMRYTDPCVVADAAIRADEDPAEALVQWARSVRTHLVIAEMGACRMEPFAMSQMKMTDSDAPMRELIAAAFVSSDAQVARLRDSLQGAELRYSADPAKALAFWRAHTLHVSRDAEADLAHAQVVQLRETLESYWHDGEILRETLGDLQGRLTEAEAELGRARTDLEQDAAEIEALRAELAQIYSSKSWRLTNPLRSARRRFGTSSLPQEE